MQSERIDGPKDTKGIPWEAKIQKIDFTCIPSIKPARMYGEHARARWKVNIVYMFFILV